MKILRFLPIALAALYIMPSCSSDHGGGDDPTPDPNLVGIAFGSSNDEWKDAQTTRSSGTRAASTGLETLFPSFRVWGLKTTDAALATQQTVMDGYNVVYRNGSDGSSLSNTDGWEYVGIKNTNLSAQQSIKYWDYSASSYRFLAYSPADATVTVTDNNSSSSSSSSSSGANKGKSFSFPYSYNEDATSTSQPYVSDLWFSTGSTTGKKYGECVKLTFKPMIAKVRFKFTYPEGTEEVTMKDIAFRDSRFIDDPSTADTPLRGTITATYPTTGSPSDTSPQYSWTSATEDATGNIILTTPWETADDKLHVVGDAADYEKWYYVPPLATVPYEQGAYTITAIIDGNYSSATVPSAFMQWQPGFQYTYIFKITEAGTMITFADVQVEQWLPGADIDNNGKGTEGW